uniref:Uncharacterized protein n=1 Tax=Arundo donax TaxID=35708 RepID=A0A0A8XNV4_ARUDO
MLPGSLILMWYLLATVKQKRVQSSSKPWNLNGMKSLNLMPWRILHQ